LVRRRMSELVSTPRGARSLYMSDVNTTNSIANMMTYKGVSWSGRERERRKEKIAERVSMPRGTCSLYMSDVNVCT
jgi:hypothetical protein